MTLRQRIAIWLCPDLHKQALRFHYLQQEVLESRTWLSEFSEVRASMQRLLDIDQARFAGGKPYSTSMWDFREQLRKGKHNLTSFTDAEEQQ